MIKVCFWHCVFKIDSSVSALDLVHDPFKSGSQSTCLANQTNEVSNECSKTIVSNTKCYIRLRTSALYHDKFNWRDYNGVQEPTPAIITSTVLHSSHNRRNITIASLIHNPTRKIILVHMTYKITDRSKTRTHDLHIHKGVLDVRILSE